MTATTNRPAPGPIVPPSKPNLLYRPEFRQAVYQILLVAGLIFGFWVIITNVTDNLARQNIASGFGFWDRTAGFDISQSLIEYTNQSTYGQAFWAGLMNTLLVAGIGLVFATVLGFLVGIGRLSSNWLIARICGAYVEILRNVPLLLQLLFWYFAVLKNLPGPRQSIPLPAGASLNVRGLYIPAPVPEPGFGAVLIALSIGVVLSIAVAIWSRRRQRETGERFPVLWTTLALVLLLPGAVYIAFGQPLSFEYPALRGFNFQGGIAIQPEFMALLVGLSTYTASFIAEIVRAGIAGVPRGQREAANAVGLSKGLTMRLVIIPQALRIIIPPLTSQYLNLAKNSSLAVAIGYPDFVSVFTGTVLNQTGQAVEVILLTMLVFLTISLITSAFMNWFNKHIALVER
jgi:general L-amino acid transport system permease protein